MDNLKRLEEARRGLLQFTAEIDRGLTIAAEEARRGMFSGATDTIKTTRELVHTMDKVLGALIKLSHKVVRDAELPAAPPDERPWSKAILGREEEDYPEPGQVARAVWSLPGSLGVGTFTEEESSSPVTLWVEGEPVVDWTREEATIAALRILAAAEYLEEDADA